MITKQITDWRYFYADAKSETTQKLDAATAKIYRFAAAVKNFRFALAKQELELVGFNVMGAWAPELYGFGVKQKNLNTPNLGDRWKKTSEPGVFTPMKGTPFYKAQTALINQYRTLPHPHIVWLLGDGGDPNNHPSLGVLLRKMPPSEKLSKNLLTVGSTTARALRLNDGWIIETPVNPNDGKFYRPPQCPEVLFGCLNIKLDGKLLCALKDFNDSERPLTGVRIYEEILRY